MILTQNENDSPKDDYWIDDDGDIDNEDEATDEDKYDWDDRDEDE